MRKFMQRVLWYLLPKKKLSQLTGRFSRHPISKKVIPYYIRYFDIDMGPVKKREEEFENLLDFFVRELHSHTRPIAEEKEVVVSPVDGVIVQIGDINEGTLLQAKGMTYSLQELLSKQEKYVHKFQNGKFVTIYLSPRDYHRIHMPCDGFVSELTYIPGQLYPVNQTGLHVIPNLFQRNERVISYINSDFGSIALIKVGAANVGSIKVVFDPAIVSNQRGKQSSHHKIYYPSITLEKGEELGRFEFGSTVILLFESNQVEWTIKPEVGTYVKMGESIAKGKYRKWG